MKGPEAGRPGAPATTQATDQFPSERRRVQGGAPVSSVNAGPLPGGPGSGNWAGRTQTTQIPLKEATPTPAAAAPRAPAAKRTPAAAPRAPSAPLDPFADMPDLQTAGRGEARPLTSLPEIHGSPSGTAAPAESFDPFAAQQGLLLDEREARELSQPSALGPRIEAATPGDALEVAFPEQKPAAPRRKARAVVPRVASPGRGRMVPLMAAVVLLGAGAGAAWFFLGRTRTTPPTQAVVHPPAAPPAAPARAPSVPAPVAAPPTAAAPPAAPVPAPSARVTPPAAKAPAATEPAATAAGGAVRKQLTSAEVGAAIRGSAKAFNACVAEAASKEPALMGRRVGLFITVNPSGVVTEPRLDDPEADASGLGACLKATALKMVFPAYGGEPFQVRIPMMLGGAR